MYRIRVNTHVTHGNKKGILHLVPRVPYEVTDKDFKTLEKSKVIQEFTKVESGGGNHDDVDGSEDDSS